MISGNIAHQLRDLAAPSGRPYAWRIDRDRGHELAVARREPGDTAYLPASEVDRSGPRYASAAAEAGLAAGHGRRFRIYDEGDVDEHAVDYDAATDTFTALPGAVAPDHPDYGLVYEGTLFAETDGDWLNAPVDDFSHGNDGLTDIRYLAADGQTWVSL